MLSLFFFCLFGILLFKTKSETWTCASSLFFFCLLCSLGVSSHPESRKCVKTQVISAIRGKESGRFVFSHEPQATKGFSTRTCYDSMRDTLSNSDENIDNSA